ncbi:MAG: hypothetical protein ACRD01_10505 [Terriglobales bacterium]
MNAEVAAALAVAPALATGGVRYLLGDSLASSYAGEPRSTMDVVVVAELNQADVAPLTRRLEATLLCGSGGGAHRGSLEFLLQPHPRS